MIRKYLDALGDYYDKYGNIFVPNMYVAGEIELGRFVQEALKRYPDIPDNTKKVFDLYGMEWEDFNFKRGCYFAEQYLKENGNLSVPQKYITPEGYELGAFITYMRQKKLSKEKTEKLNSLNMVWNTYDKSFDAWLQLLKEWLQIHPFCPSTCVYKGKPLGRWLDTVINQYNKGKLSEERIKMLEDVNFRNLRGSIGVSFPEKAIFYYISKYDSKAQPNAKIFDGRKLELDIYLPDRNIGIEYDGQAFHSNNKRDNEKNTLCQEKGIRLIRVREPKAPIMLRKGAEQRYLKEEGLNAMIEGLLYDLFGVSESVDVNDHYNEIYQMTMQPQKDFQRLAIIKQYHQEFGTINVASMTDYKGEPIGKWIERYRGKYKKGTLPKNVEKELLLMGINWDFVKTAEFKTMKQNSRKKEDTETWMGWYELARKYSKEHNGVLCLSHHNGVYEGRNLGNWLSTQKAIRNGKGGRSRRLEQWQIDLLDDIGMVWENIREDTFHSISEMLQ